MPTGATLQLIANGEDKTGNEVNISSIVSWSTENSSVATISASGMLETLDIGTTDIIVKHENVTLVQTVNVIDMVLTITTSATQFLVGDNPSFSATVKSTNNELISENELIVWDSSDKSIASIDTNGVMDLIAPGAIVITGKFFGVTGVYNVQIDDALPLHVDQIHTNSISLRWASKPNADYYRLSWTTAGYSTLGGELISGVENNIRSTTFLHENLNADTYYQYRLEAIEVFDSVETILFESNLLNVNMPGNNSAVLTGETIGRATHTNLELVKNIALQIDNPLNFISIDQAILSQPVVDSDVSLPILTQYIVKISNTSDLHTYCNVFLNGISALAENGTTIKSNNSATSFSVGGIRTKSNGSGGSENTANHYCIGPQRSAYVYDFIIMSSEALKLTRSLWSSGLGVKTASVDLSYPASVVTPISYSVINDAASNNQQLRVIVKNIGSQAVSVTDSSKYILLNDQDIPLGYGSLSLDTGWSGDLAVNESNILIANIKYTGTANKIHVYVNF